MTTEQREVNGYVCSECKGWTWIRHADPGTTPMLLACRATTGCKGTMKSVWYHIPFDTPVNELHITFEWFKPTDLGGYGPEMREHIERGGLDLRPIRCTRADSPEGCAHSEAVR